MLRIGKLTDYAVLILGQMARSPQQLLSASVLAEGLKLSVPTVSKILKILSDYELVTATRGAEGGYRLSRTPAQISLADVITSMEGGLAMTVCCERSERCAIYLPCTMRENWLKVNQTIYDMLAKISISEMLSPLSFEKLTLTEGNFA